MPRPYTQLIVVNVVPSLATVVLVFDAPLLSAVAGAILAGAVLYVGQYVCGWGRRLGRDANELSGRSGTHRANPDRLQDTHGY